MADITMTAEPAGAVIYRSVVNVEPAPGKLKMLHLPLTAEPVPMGVHGAIAAHYKLAEGTYTPHASTLDYIVAATAGCLMGPLSTALMARQIATGEGRLTGEAVGEIENEGDVLVIRRIRFRARLQASEAQREAAERVVAHYATKCPVHRSLETAIAITTELDFQPIA